MKKILRSLVASSLAILARIILWKYRPTVVMITGSVGKTSTKDAVAAALSQGYLLRASEKSYNSEFGVPLTIIGAKNPWENAGAWLRVIEEALALIILPNHYPKMLVLEVGADSPGDLSRILSIATPDAVVVTKLPEIPVHVEAYASPAAVREEEFQPAYALPEGCPLIVSADDQYASGMAKRLNARVLTVGYNKDADLVLSEPHFTHGGMQTTVMFGESTCTLEAKGALGRSQLYAPAMALALATALHMTVEEALIGLASYAPPPGRARILKGKRGSIIIDDSYNASPAAVEEALASLSLVPGSRVIVAIGDMLELGRYSMQEHERIGTLVGKKADMVVTVGERAVALREAAVRAGITEDRALGFKTSIEAAHALQEQVQEGDVVLVKGSQSVRMERVVEALLQDPSDARFLVRQDKEWKRR